MAGATAYAEDEQTPAALANVGKPVRHGIDLTRIEGLRELGHRPQVANAVMAGADTRMHRHPPMLAPTAEAGWKTLPRKKTKLIAPKVNTVTTYTTSTGRPSAPGSCDVERAVIPYWAKHMLR